ncbi:MAG TPA: polymer-forming cytoskeletal protein [Candidatus Saccharimonas sp.]|nr:polymer-forming cytoskeletal protein [Candidatus Saccharimonas sp.]
MKVINGEWTMKRVLAYMAAILALLVVPGAVWAMSGQSGNDITLAKGTTNHGTLWVAGKNVLVDGDVDGDLVCAGSNVTVNGTVTGDVICAGQTLTLNGKVGGSVRVAGQSVTVNSEIARNLWVAGQDLTLGASGKVAGELAAVGDQLTVNGPVGTDAYGAVSMAMINSAIGGSVNFQAGDLTLGDAAHIKGNLDYTNSADQHYDPSKVEGAVTRHDPPKHEENNSPRDVFLAWLLSRLYWIVADLAVGLVLVWVAPRAIRALLDRMKKRMGASIGFGALALFTAPIVLVMVAMTSVGLPLALEAGLLGLFVVSISATLAGIAIGSWILKRADWKADSLWMAALIGVPVAILLFSVPVLGALAKIVATCWSVGGLILAGAGLRR